MKKSTKVALWCGGCAAVCIAGAIYFKKRRQTGGAVACGALGGCAAAGCVICALRKSDELLLAHKDELLFTRITRLGDAGTRNASEQRTRSTERRGTNVHDRISQAVRSHMSFTSEDAMARDVFVTEVLLTARVKPGNWPDPNWTTVKGYRDYMKDSLSPTHPRAGTSF